MSEYIWTLATSGRMGGKVLKAVSWLREDPDNRMIVVSSQEQADDLKERFGVTGEQVRVAPA